MPFLWKGSIYKEKACIQINKFKFQISIVEKFIRDMHEKEVSILFNENKNYCISVISNESIIF
jgi:hypothetical protein